MAFLTTTQTGPRLYNYVSVSTSDRVNADATGGIDPTAFADPAAWLLAKMAPAIAAGVRRSLIGNVYGIAPVDYKSGAFPSNWPDESAGTAISVSYQSRAMHDAALESDTSWLDGLTTALATYIPQQFEIGAYSGPPKFDAASDNASLDHETAFERSLGLTIWKDSLNFLDFCDDTLPAVKWIRRLVNVQGIRPIGEVLTLRTIRNAYGWAHNTAGSIQSEALMTRVLADPATWFTRETVKRVNGRAIVFFNVAAGTPSFRISRAAYWAGLGYDVVCDMTDFTGPQLASMVSAFNSAAAKWNATTITRKTGWGFRYFEEILIPGGKPRLPAFIPHYSVTFGDLYTGDADGGFILNNTRLNAIVDAMPSGYQWLQLDGEADVNPFEIFTNGTTLQQNNFRAAMIATRDAAKARAATNGRPPLYVGWYPFPGFYTDTLDWAKDPTDPDKIAAHNEALAAMARVVENLPDHTAAFDFVDVQMFAIEGTSDVAVGNLDIFCRARAQDYKSVYTQTPVFALGLTYQLEVSPQTGKPINAAIARNTIDAARRYLDGISWFTGDMSVRHFDYEVVVSNLTTLKTKNAGQFALTLGGVTAVITGLNFTGCTTIADCATVLQAGIRSYFQGIPSPGQVPFHFTDTVTVTGSGLTFKISMAPTDATLSLPPDSGSRTILIFRPDLEDHTLGLQFTGLLTANGVSQSTSPDPAAWQKWVAGGYSGGVFYPQRDWWKVIAGSAGLTQASTRQSRARRN